MTGQRITSPDIDEALSTLRGALRRMHRLKGAPSYREIQRMTGRQTSHATVGDILRCLRKPSYDHLERVVLALDGDVAEIKRLWLAVCEAEDRAGRATTVPVERTDPRQEMTINIARRSQTLVDRLIDLVSRLRYGEEDPARGARLAQLDRLATRMRRTNESLLVIADSASGWERRDPATLPEIVQSATAQIENDSRVGYDDLNPDLVVDPKAVTDLVHLLAELLDNAVTFSPPHTRVTVRAHRTRDAVVIRIEDRGLGISPTARDELNQRLARPSPQDLANSRMIGITVVARLAARHRIGVQLIAAPDQGTVAELSLPPDIVTQPARGPRAPDRRIRTILAELPLDKAQAMIDCLSEDQRRQVFAGWAAERAEAHLDQTRAPNWPAVDFSPQTVRPGFTNSRPTAASDEHTKQHQHRPNR